MASLLAVVSVVGSILITPFLMILLSIIFLASIGKSIGVRRLYIKLLLWIFEYGRVNIEVAQKKIRKDESYEEIPDENPDPGGDAKKTEPQKSLEHNSSIPNGVVKNGYLNQNGTTLINREDNLILLPDPSNGQKLNTSPENHEIAQDAANGLNKEESVVKHFELSLCLDYIKAGVEAIIEDQVTQRFQTEELKNWNLMTRTNRHYEFISWRLTFIWMCGFVVRYFFLFPLRVIICCIGMSFLIFSTSLVSILPDNKLRPWIYQYLYRITNRILMRSLSGSITFYNQQYKPTKSGVCVANHTTPIDVLILSVDNSFSLLLWLTFCTAMVGYAPEGPFKAWLNRKVSIMCFGILSSALSSVITYHGKENMPKNGICVANHTSPIDVLMLMCDNCYSLIGQRHGGFLGVVQRALARASPHIWFERSEAKDRHTVATRLKEHVSNPNNPPILIFPEGTCINNTSVMQFKKGSFEVNSVIYPVAIKYDPRFGDAFWDSSRYSYIQYLYMMMTSWAIVCEVWYLPPMYRNDGENAIDFANRVKSVIAKQGGLVDLVWDGQLKRIKPKKEWKERQQEEFSKTLK